MSAPETAVDEVMFYPINFGMLGIDCPTCESECTGIFVGLITLEEEDESSEQDSLPNMTQMGSVAYPCGHIFCSPCLTDKIATIMNARENNELRLSMFMNLIECKDHGVEYPDQS